MNNYRDSLGFWHDSDMVESQNVFIYTAYAKNLGLDIPDKFDLFRFFNGSTHNTQYGFWVNRKPNLSDPVISHDEIIGMISLGIIDSHYLEDKNWSTTTFTFRDFSIIKQLRAVWSLKGKHRTYVHREEIIEAYPIVFKLLPHIKYYAKKMTGVRTTHVEYLAFHISILLDIFQSSAWSSTHNLATLMLEDLNSKFLINFYDKKSNYLDYFKAEHDFVKALK
ncbi:MAG: hypothetical protein ACI9IA_000212 [Enterobacterales bacterium]|jgi:hypothetical protein